MSWEKGEEMPTERYPKLPEEKRRLIWRDYYDFNRKRLIERHGDYWAMQMDGLEYFLPKERQNAAAFRDVFVQQ